MDVPVDLTVDAISEPGVELWLLVADDKPDWPSSLRVSLSRCLMDAAVLGPGEHARLTYEAAWARSRPGERPVVRSRVDLVRCPVCATQPVAPGETCWDCRRPRTTP